MAFRRIDDWMGDVRRIAGSSEHWHQAQSDDGTTALFIR
jgi:hypothetical protein